MSRADRCQESETPWTASRCNRTLRQLTAFLVKVEKWHKDFSHKRLGQNSEFREDVASVSSIEPSPGDTKIDDPKWLCRQDRQVTKRAEKSYAGRRKTRQGPGGFQKPKCLPYTPKAPKTAETIIDTPLMTSILSSPNMQSSDLSNDLQIPEPQLKPKVPFLRWSKCEKATDEANPPSLSRWSNLAISEMKQIVRSFLVATSQSRLAGERVNNDLYPRKGAKSLFSSCLHKIPSLIITEQSHHDVNPDGYDGEVQVATGLLTDLEDHYGDPHKGWGPLRVVTRAYGIALICNAIRKRFLPVEAAMALASCLTDDFGVNEVTLAIVAATAEVRQTWSADDVSGILTACVNVSDSKCDTDPMWSTAKSDAAALRFQLINMAFRSTSQPVLWGLISARPTFLRDAVRSCSRRQQPGAVSLVKTLLLRFLDLSPERAEALTARVRQGPENSIGASEDEVVDADDSLLPENVPASLVATNSLVSKFRSSVVALAAFPLSRKMRHRQSNPEHLRDGLAQCASVCIFRDICLAIQVDMEIHGTTHLTQEQLQRRAWILFTYNLLVQVLPLPNAIHSLTGNLVNLMRSCESRKGLVTGLSSIVLDVVMACDLTYERGGRVHRFSMLKEITGSLVRRATCHSPAPTLLFWNVAIEASMAYARIGGKDNPDGLLWATELQQRAQASLSREDNTSLTPSLKTFASRFRWDECISEWVAETPSAAQVHLTRLRSEGRDDTASHISFLRVNGLPTPPVSMPDSPVDDSISRRMKKRKSVPEQRELHWDGDFAFRRPAKKSRSLGGEIALPPSMVDVESEDELSGCY